MIQVLSPVGIVACYEQGTWGAAVFGKPWECGAAVVGLDFVGLFPSGESVVGLVPEGAP